MGVDRAANQRPEEVAATESPKTDKQATPAMAIESCSECETSERETQSERHRVAFGRTELLVADMRLLEPDPSGTPPVGRC